MRRQEVDSVDREIEEIVDAVRIDRYKHDPHVSSPNHIPVATRRLYVIQSLGLILYGAFGLWVDDLYVPGVRGKEGVHFHGTSALLIYAAMLAAAANLLAVVVDHYDTRHNEHRYRAFAKWSEIAAWILAIAGALAIGIS